MKRSTKLFLILFSFVGFSPVVFAATDVEVKFCEDINILKGLRVVGVLIKFCKILVPVILVIVGMKSLFNAVIEDDDKATKAAVNGLIKKVIFGVVIFFTPTVFNAILLQIDKWNKLEGKFANCSICSIDYDKEKCDSLIGD